MEKFVVMLRVKDGIAFVSEWLSCYEKLADEIVVLDNGSTDGTLEALSCHPKVVVVVRTEGFNEGRDKNLLYAHVRKRNPTWCLWVDVDEVFEKEFTRRELQSLMRSRIATRFAFRRFHFIDRTHFAGSWYRLNYSSGHDRIMWRESPTGYFQDIILDSPNIKGIRGLKINTTYGLKHLGYIDKHIVDRKAELYCRYIAPEKEAALDKMYMRNEYPIRWRDNRRHPKVVLLNILLDLLHFKNLSIRVKDKTVSVLRSRLQFVNKSPERA